jgi:chromosome segregation ATPase
MTDAQQILQKLSEIESNLTAAISKLDNKIDLGFTQVDTKLAELKGEITTRSARLESKFDPGFVRLDSKINNLSERINLVEESAGKITDIAEKVGYVRVQQQFMQSVLTILVTLLIGGGINYLIAGRIFF